MRRRNGDAFEIGEEQLVDERAVTLEVPAGSLVSSPASEPRTAANGVEGLTGEAKRPAERKPRPRRPRGRRRPAAARVALGAFALGALAVAVVGVGRLGGQRGAQAPATRSAPRPEAAVGRPSRALGRAQAARDGASESRWRELPRGKSRVASAPTPAPSEPTAPAPAEPLTSATPALIGPPASSPAMGQGLTASSPPTKAASADREMVAREFGP